MAFSAQLKLEFQITAVVWIESKRVVMNFEVCIINKHEFDYELCACGDYMKLESIQFQ